eukprot:scaffold7876_cov417-Prasinococcus_capsulatus_cf.AAC.10
MRPWGSRISALGPWNCARPSCRGGSQLARASALETDCCAAHRASMLAVATREALQRTRLSWLNLGRAGERFFCAQQTFPCSRCNCTPPCARHCSQAAPIQLPERPPGVPPARACA